MEYSDQDVKRLLARREKAVGMTQQWGTIFRDAYKYAMPNRDPWATRRTAGSSLADDVYDTTLIDATNKFVNSSINALVPPKRKFLSYVAGEAVPEDKKKVFNEYLQQVTDTFFLYLRKSNFDQVVAEAFYDMAVSTGVMQFDEGSDEEPFVFSAAPSDQVSFETGPKGDFTAFYRDWRNVTPGQAREMWPFEDFKLPPSVEEKQRNKTEEVQCTFYEISYWCDKSKKYKYLVIESESKMLCYAREEESWSWVAFRMKKLPGESRGRGLVLDALPAAMSLNKAMYDELAAAGVQANPTYMAYTDNVINPFTFVPEPNSIIPVRPDGTGSWPIAPLPQAGNPQFGLLVAEDLRQQIRNIMLADPTVLSETTPVQTATFVAAAQRNNIENKVATYGRLQFELLDQLARRGLYILAKKGLIEPIKLDNRVVSITFATPLVQSNEMLEVEQFSQFYQGMQAMLGPEVALGAIDVPKLPAWVAEKMDVDLSLVKGPAEIMELLQQGREQIEQSAEPGTALPA